MRALPASFRRGARQDSAQPDVHSAPRLAKSRSISLFSSKAPKQPLETSPDLPFLTRVSGGGGGGRPDLTPASSASSDGSSSLRTPEDEGLMAFPSAAQKQDEKKKWPTWLSSWRRSTDSLRDSAAAAAAASELGERHPPHGPHRALGISTQTAAPSSHPQRSQSETEDDSSDDEYNDNDDDDDAPTPVGRPTAQQHIPTRAQVLQAQSNVRNLLRNTLIPLASPPPLVDGAQHSFPRSSNPASHKAPRIPTLEQLLHTRRSLQRLDRRPLTLSEARSIAPLANRPKIKPAGRVAALGIERANNKSLALDYESVADVSMRVGRYSRGLRRWAARPCFEQRFRVWQPDASGEAIVPLGVTGVERPVAICDLEYSEWVEQLAGLRMDAIAFENAITRSFNTLPRKHSPPRNSPRRNTFNRHPSPLRVERASPAEPVVSPVSSTSAANANRDSVGSPLPMLADLDLPKPLSLSAPHDAAKAADSPTSSASGSSTSKEDEDNVPLEYLGYALLAKKRKEEKERFLAAEREKRELNRSLLLAEEAKRKMEADRRRAENEARKAEEMQKVVLAEEIAAVRRRRENARLGVEAYDNIREMNRMSKGESYARPAYDISPLPASAGRRASGYFPSPESPLERISGSSTPSPLPSTPDTKEKNERRKSVVPPAAGKPSLNTAPTPIRPSASRHSSMPRPRPQQEPVVERPDSVISSTSSANTRRASLIRSTSAPNTNTNANSNTNALPPYPMMSMQAIPPVPVPPMPVWNMNMNMGMNMGMGVGVGMGAGVGMGGTNMPPLMMPNAPFMMQQRSHSPHSHSGSPSPVSGSPGTSNHPFSTSGGGGSSGGTRSRSRSGSRSRSDHNQNQNQRTEQSQSPARRQSQLSLAVPMSTTGTGSSHSHAHAHAHHAHHHHHHPQQQQQQFSNNVSVVGGSASARSRHSIYSQAAAAAVTGSGSYVSLNRSSSQLAPSAVGAAGVGVAAHSSAAGKSPAKRMSSMLGPHSPPHKPSLQHSSSNSNSNYYSQRRSSVYGNVNVANGGHGHSHALAAPPPPTSHPHPHAKRRSTMM